MNARITYIHHNCFFLRLAGRTFLFDLPAPAHLPAEATGLVRRLAEGADLTAFVSHGHEDHFDPGLAKALSGAARLRYVVSYDVPDMYPEALPDDPEMTLVVEPDESREFDGLRVESLESNDLGVAFLLEIEGRRVYFGGDLADWAWPGQPEPARRFSREFFASALERLAAKGVDLAFSNVDGRLPNLAGGPEFVRVVRPQVFVPMHTFGRTKVLARFVSRLGDTRTRIFAYRASGDEAIFDL